MEFRSYLSKEKIREGIFNLLLLDYPDLSMEDYISIEELNHYRRLYVTSLINKEKGELAVIDYDMMYAIRNNSILSEDVQEEIESKITVGGRLADSVALLAGSWIFIIAFFSFIFLWMAVNFTLWRITPFDPYPFILLNLLLSCLAAIQAPNIMMSQNRQEKKDRSKAEHDYKINLKAELEIKLLSEKIDHLMVHQNKKLLEIQEVQTDYLEDLLKVLKKNSPLKTHRKFKNSISE